MNSPSPIAQFTEVTFEARRHFTLFPNKLEIEGKQRLGARYAQTVELAQLEPNFDTLVAFPPHLTTAWLPFIVAGFISYSVTVYPDWPPPTIVVCILIVFVLAGILMLAANYRKRTYALFNSISGQPRVSLCSDSRNREEFDSFVHAIQETIKKTQSSEQGAAGQAGERR